ncbi:MAG: hypothetical protein PVG11_09650 [Anaerolineae bacterium]
MNEAMRQKKVIGFALATTCLLWLLTWGASDEPARADTAVNQTIPTMTPTGGVEPTTRPSVVPPEASPETTPTRAPTDTPVSAATASPIPTPTPSPLPSSTEGPAEPAAPTPTEGATVQLEETVAPSPTPVPEQVSAPASLTPAGAGAITLEPIARTPAAALIETGSGEKLTLERAALPLSCAWVGVGIALLAAGVALLVGSRHSSA